ncbi:MAG: hypothetical protein UX85_C0001G0225 [Candidatus Beckwithbacteria bacterium GW2011_GWB1_47_15]|uniref:Peptidase S11 D-alanyl-D-alanine carboxypeptidase A N-terminal domain-containing protein n=1 Tax=Candidatus Beckwithbacteria bacterium GW2011_GWB1_47_15 TaxID=1618371 RepID=A0A0G1RY27_9BACT|nr:MAG: serine-type D-Ala-D-Ala carboxypeptidase, D-alanyl-D-alanine carboxypeptidase (penicillin-binding protein 5/6) [Candidatus Beckwithbacteria bacterium GW2011_GWC1_49_16]AQS30863.1 hypothetical protein [uncultured bacterium]KKU36047.1 MAG: hypothetical protein UX50_C0001G0224 [Candidatus Beckwithbacteria bacterium GW2011_GWA1_46_30]KKU62011.1 MAG: hypothetical protein UX85_C0001G0225 [Candidatus Beckwithbacteria bacterium GW2011_GWB1_47_15]KKU72435.1 MAG: hypothetical protein UX97_C0001G0
MTGDSKLKLIFASLILSLVPARNHYYDLYLSAARPPVKEVNAALPEPVGFYPVNLTGIPAPYTSAPGVVVLDADSKAILYQKNPDLKLLPASTTKIVTGLIALEHYPLDQVITIDSIGVVGQTMKLALGERISVENLLYGLLVASANDAAAVLAQHYPGGEDAFIAAMNQKVKDLNLTNTQFQNATGLDAYGHYTTAHDLGLIAAAAMANPTFAKMVSTTGITVSDVDSTIFHQLETINELLGRVDGLSGVKTGWTELAGECLVTSTQRDGRAVITVVLGSSDRFGESVKLIDWAFINHRWESSQAIH